VAPDVPFSPGVLAPFAPLSLGPGFLQGGWLAAADFSTGPNTGPAIACVLDAGNLTHVGAVTGFELISIFGANLGPATGVAAPDGTDASIPRNCSMLPRRRSTWPCRCRCHRVR
jgi:hypothetical protein